MIRKLRVLPEAEAELLAAAEWYEKRRAGLGVEFVADAERAIESILERPEAHPKWGRGVAHRKRVLERFPFLIIFKSSENEILVIAFAHAKRRPGYWLRRRDS